MDCLHSKPEPDVRTSHGCECDRSRQRGNQRSGLLSHDSVLRAAPGARSLGSRAEGESHPSPGLVGSYRMPAQLHPSASAMQTSAWQAPSFARSNISREMGFADVWNKTLVYFGIAEEDDWDEEAYVTDEDLQRSYAERPNVRRLAPRRREREFDDWTEPETGNERTAVLRPRVAAVPGPA